MCRRRVGAVTVVSTALRSAGRQGSVPAADGSEVRGVPRKVTYSMGISLDGYVVGPDGSFDWAGPDDELFRFAIDQVREVGVHLMGRKLYETMLYWEDPEQQAGFDDAEREWAALWNPLPKVVFSRTLTSVQGAARLATGDLREEVERLRAESGAGRHRRRRGDPGRAGRRAGPGRRVPAQAVPGGRRRRHPVLPARRAAAGPGADGQPHVRLRRRLRDLPAPPGRHGRRRPVVASVEGRPASPAGSCAGPARA